MESQARFVRAAHIPYNHVLTFLLFHQYFLCAYQHKRQTNKNNNNNQDSEDFLKI